MSHNALVENRYGFSPMTEFLQGVISFICLFLKLTEYSLDICISKHTV